MGNAGVTVLAELAGSQWGLVTTAQAGQAGVTAQTVSRLTKAGQLERLVQGVYRMAGRPPHLHDELRAAWLAMEPSRSATDRIASNSVEVVSHRSAAVVHDLGDIEADILEFTTDWRRQTRRADVRIYRGTVGSQDWTLVDGLPVTTPLRTIADLASARLDRAHLAGVVRDTVLGHTVPVGTIAAVLGPHAREYGVTAGDGRGLTELMLEEAGIPDSLLSIAEGAYSPRFQTGRALGSRYVLAEQLGSGVNGQVWRAWRREDGKQVAVKRLRAEHGRYPEAAARFLQQRAVLAALEHPHLVRVHDLVVEGDVLAVVMDLVEGKELREVTLRHDEKLAVLGQIAAALSAVHAAGSVHRGVEPGNVLVRTEHGRPYALLAHPGVAGDIAGPTELTRLSQRGGTVAYVAPELVTGEPATAATDVYALGMMAYELLAGGHPFTEQQARSAAALLGAHLEAVPARPPRLAEPIWSLLRTMLAKDPVDRPTAATVATRLHDVVEQTSPR